jgi:hypothetical protein
MKCGARIALGVAGGYFLGRTRKMKLALMLGGMAAGRSAGGPGQLLAQGGRFIGQSEELTKLADEVRGRLLDAGKNAAVAVATRQVESLTDRVGRRVEDLAQPSGLRSRSGSARGSEDTRDEPRYDEDDEPDDEEPTSRARPSRPTPAARRPTTRGVVADAGTGRAKTATSTGRRAGGSSSGTARRGSNTAGASRSSARARRRTDDG